MEKNSEISYSSKLDDYATFTAYFEMPNNQDTWLRKKIKVSVEIKSKTLYKDYVFDFDILKHILALILLKVEEKYVITSENKSLLEGKITSDKCFVIKEKKVGMFYLCQELLSIFVNNLKKDYAPIIEKHEGLTVEFKLNDENEVYCVEQRL